MVEIKRNHISSNTGKILLKQEFFRWVTNIHEHKDITIPLIIHYLLLQRAFRTNLPLNHNVVLPCQHRGVGIMQYVYALNPVCIVLFPDASRKEVPVRAIGHNWLRIQ